MNKPIALIYGKSGVGKTTVVQRICEISNKTEVQSYTTRPERYDNEKGHIFVNEEQFMEMRNDMVGYTYFNGYYYGATKQQMLENDIYVVDIAGIEYFNKVYDGDRKVLIIEIEANPLIRFFRLINRDGFIKGIKRYIYDFKAFRDKPKCNNLFSVNNFNIDECAFSVVNIINEFG